MVRLLSTSLSATAWLLSPATTSSATRRSAAVSGIASSCPLSRSPARSWVPPPPGPWPRNPWRGRARARAFRGPPGWTRHVGAQLAAELDEGPRQFHPAICPRARRRPHKAARAALGLRRRPPRPPGRGQAGRALPGAGQDDLAVGERPGFPASAERSKCGNRPAAPGRAGRVEDPCCHQVTPAFQVPAQRESLIALGGRGQSARFLLKGEYERMPNARGNAARAGNAPGSPRNRRTRVRAAAAAARRPVAPTASKSWSAWWASFSAAVCRAGRRSRSGRAALPPHRCVTPCGRRPRSPVRTCPMRRQARLPRSGPMRRRPGWTGPGR